MNLQRLRMKLEPALRRLFHVYWRFARGMTLGVRAVVLDGDDRVFLVKHSYVSGWHLPGGGVEAGETLREALQRELFEEGRIEISGEPALHGLFLNSHVSPRDHVAVYLVRHFTQECPSRTARSSRAAFSTRAPCRRKPPWGPGCGFRKPWKTGRQFGPGVRER